MLRQPERVQRVLEQLRPMAGIGPISLDEARDVVADRLQMLAQDAADQRWEVYEEMATRGPEQFAPVLRLALNLGDAWAVAAVPSVLGTLPTIT